ncbi:type IV toxin-antitoxin system AbiEi family antitoxin [Geothrix sp. PMB-07]|uniref:type IV toxin-antitoxin system AbiEi family antitoxin n=1 Tax=Geothrix sp. PMB-07 TaxID=3068640 RepID=UPI002741BFD9|nr:type IV toxin-antitoxin system AbiEi family antitoxin [Geothrix sp. PMB-07]WLT30888.1 type IV toxin-antitoxin system AbiEi family antitoxin [Geothrix sp. PMB-07]
MIIHREVELIDAALARFEAQTGLQAIREPIEDHLGPDGRVRIIDGPRQWVFDVECKNRVDRLAMLHGVQAQIQGFANAGLLMVPYLAPELARQCQSIGLPFMDAAGNAFLKREGLYALVTGQKPDKALLRPEKPMRAFDRTGLRVVFALLAAPKLVQAPYRDLAKAAGVALGTVGWILTDLREHGFLVDIVGERRWIDRQRVIQAWTTNYPLRLRERLRVRRFAAKDDTWWENANPGAFGGFWGGEIAAAKLHGDLIPKTVTIYLPEDRKDFLAKHRLRADPQGLIEVLDVFWDFPPAPEIPEGIAPPLLVYTDLLTIGDPRTLEEARRIHDHYLA